MRRQPISSGIGWPADVHDLTEVRAVSGTVYQVQTNAFWDSRKEGDLRIIVALDDGGWRAFLPLSEDFIIAPDGRFIDE